MLQCNQVSKVFSVSICNLLYCFEITVLMLLVFVRVSDVYENMIISNMRLKNLEAIANVNFFISMVILTFSLFWIFKRYPIVVV
jgi:hypothetical protein